MKLSHFAKTIKADVDAFTEDWIERNVKAPCEWPFEMDVEEFWWRFLGFMEKRNGSV